MVSTPDSGQKKQPLVRKRGEGQAWWWFNSLALVKAASHETGGLLTVLEITDPPHDATPLHVHHNEDETFLMLEGTATFVIGNTTVDAEVGDVLYGPRDIPHRYTAGPEGCRMLFILTPGGMDEMIAEMSRPADRLELPPPMEEEPDWEQISGIATAYGNEILG